MPANGVSYLPNLNHGLPFSSAAIHGDLVILSGEIGIDPSGVIPAGIQDQAKQALDNIEATLKRLGSDRSDIVKCTIMMDDMRQWAEFNEVYVRYFAGRPLPARSAFGVSALALGALVEIECLAVVRPDDHQGVVQAAGGF